MSRISSFDARLDALEQSGGYVTLPDGSKFRPASGLSLMREAIKFERDHGREPKLADFSMERADLWQRWAEWHPEKGELAKMTSDLARRICDI